MYNRPLHAQLVDIPEGVTLPTPPFANVSHTPGQSAAIRFFDPESHEDLQAMREILKGKQSKKWMDDSQQISQSEYRDWAGTATNTSFLFAVLDARSNRIEEMKHVRGFVYIYSEREEKFRVKRMEKRGLLSPSSAPRYVLEASFAMRPLQDGVQTGSGLMSSALRQSCLQVQVLLDSPQHPEVILFSFVHPDNLPAQRTLEACCFVRQGQMKYDWDSPDETYLYILNWRLLKERVREKLAAVLQTQKTG